MSVNSLDPENSTMKNELDALIATKQQRNKL